MPEKLDNQRGDDQYADIRGRFGDLLQEDESGRPRSRWAGIKDRLAIVAVTVVLALLVFFMIDGSFTNFRCTFAEFVTLECNRWAGEEHPSLRFEPTREREQ